MHLWCGQCSVLWLLYKYLHGIYLSVCGVESVWCRMVCTMCMVRCWECMVCGMVCGVVCVVCVCCIQWKMRSNPSSSSGLRVCHTLVSHFESGPLVTMSSNEQNRAKVRGCHFQRDHGRVLASIWCPTCFFPHRLQCTLADSLWWERTKTCIIGSQNNQRLPQRSWWKDKGNFHSVSLSRSRLGKT